MTKNIKILGPGCPKCKALTRVVQDTVSENNLDATIEKVQDITEIMEYNVLTTPALLVDNQVVIKGRVPSKGEILAVLA